MAAACSIIEATDDDLRAWCVSHGEPEYRARQIRRWIVHGRAATFDAMTDLPKSVRSALQDNWRMLGSSIIRTQRDFDGTVKLLLSLADGRSVECVLLCEADRRTICMSTQVGCGMGCVFCASGLGGLERSLSAGEMIEELVHVSRQLDESERLTHIVVMGMGEPLANLDALLQALEFATSPAGLGISGRHVTVSTVGLPAKIRNLADAGKPYSLAVSLHASNDALRRRIVPTAAHVTLAEILEAADDYRGRTGRQVTFEYVLLAGVNDQPSHADELARLLAGRDVMLNLIPYNPVSELEYARPDDESIEAFAGPLRRHGFVVKIRKRKGGNIDAACGQLRRVTPIDAAAS